MLTLYILIFIAVVAAFVAWIGGTIHPIIGAVIALFSVVIILANFFAVFGWAGPMEFLHEQSWIIVVSGGTLIGSILGVFRIPV